MGLHQHQAKDKKSIVKETYNFFPVIELLQSSVFLNTRQVLVESSITDIFAHLTLYKIPAMALTAMVTGRLGVIKKMHDFRFQQLGSVNFSFKHLSPLDGAHEMLELTTINKRFLDANCKVAQC